MDSKIQTYIFDCCRTKEALYKSISSFTKHFDKGAPGILH